MDFFELQVACVVSKLKESPTQKFGIPWIWLRQFRGSVHIPMLRIGNEHGFNNAQRMHPSSDETETVTSSHTFWGRIPIIQSADKKRRI
jgi:hypothetical protein